MVRAYVTRPSGTQPVRQGHNPSIRDTTRPSGTQPIRQGHNQSVRDTLTDAITRNTESTSGPAESLVIGLRTFCYDAVSDPRPSIISQVPDEVVQYARTLAVYRRSSIQINPFVLLGRRSLS
jgi:hypothetical protein